MSHKAVLFLLLVLGIAALGDKSHYILQISDQHLEWQYHEGTDPTKEWCRSNTKGNAGRYGDYHCHSPEALVHANLVDAKKRFPKPDFIFWTGDMRRGFATVKGNDEVYDTLKNMTTQLKKAFPGVQAFPVLGNHDVHPNNMHGPQRAALYKRIVPLWSDWLDSYAQKTFAQGGYYVRYMNGYSVIVLNTCMYITSDTETASQADPANQLAWFQQILSSSPDKHFYVLGHCPIHHSWYDAPRNKLLSIVRKHHSQIEGIFMGHLHIDLTSLIFDEAGTTPLIVQYCSPSIATRPGGIHDGHNPSYRVYYRHIVNGTAQMALDSHETYYLPLAKANKELKGDFYFEYGSHDGKHPGLDVSPPITAAKWYQALQTTFENATLTHELYNRYNVHTVTANDKCDNSCLKSLRCNHLYYADKTQFSKCK